MTDSTPSLAALLASIRPGTDQEAGEQLKLLIDAVIDTAKPGYLTLRIDLGVADDGGSALVVKDKITVKLPEHDRKPSLAFVNAGGNGLQRTNPNLMPLFEDN